MFVSFSLSVNDQVSYDLSTSPVTFQHISFFLLETYKLPLTSGIRINLLSLSSIQITRRTKTHTSTPPPPTPRSPVHHQLTFPLSASQADSGRQGNKNHEIASTLKTQLPRVGKAQTRAGKNFSAIWRPSTQIQV